MDTDLLELGSDGAAATTDVDDLYSKAAGATRRPVQASASANTLMPSRKPNVGVDRVEPTATLPAQSSTLPDPPAAHSISARAAHYKSPGPVGDGVPAAAGARRPGPELLPPKSAAASIPAIPPRKQRLATPAGDQTPPPPPPAKSVRYDTIRYDTRCYFNVRSKADMSA